MSETVGCDTCSTTVNGDGTVTHEKKCPLQALRKIGHILKEAGINVAEGAAEIATSGLGAMQDD